jgi:broad-specificity NMP kinase
MRKKLIFIGGPPGVGKSTAAGLLFEELNNAAWLDGDDVWRMNPFVVNEKTISLVENNVRYVLNSFIQSEVHHIIFTWVLHTEAIATSLLSGIDLSEYEFSHFTLTSSYDVLEQRIASDVGRKTDTAIARDRLNQAKKLSTIEIDTTDMTVVEVTELIKSKILN